MTRISTGIDFCTATAVVTGTAGGPPPRPPAAGAVEVASPPVQLVPRSTAASTGSQAMRETRDVMKACPRVRDTRRF